MIQEVGGSWGRWIVVASDVCSGSESWLRLCMCVQMEAAAEREQEKRMDEGPLTLETLNRSEEGGEGFLQLLHTLVAEAGGKDTEAEAEGESM